MDLGSISLTGLRARLERHRAYVRAELALDGGAWHLVTLEATVGARPPAWSAQSWAYPTRAFVAAEVAGRTLAGAFSEDGGAALRLGRVSASVPVVYGSVRWTHLPSRAPYGQSPLPWPSVDYEVSAPQDPRPSSPDGFLVADGCPSFTSAETAMRAFFYGDYATVGAGRTSSRTALIRVVEREAYVARVRVTATHVDCLVAGSAAAGARIEINSGAVRATAPVPRAGAVRLPLPFGLPRDAWLFLTRGSSWLDYRALGPDLAGARGGASQGVELVIPVDPESTVRALIAGGEGQETEFKREVPGAGPEAWRNVAKTAAAFANGAGGTIVFGVDRDEATLIPVPGEDRVVRDRVVDQIRRLVRPTPELDVRWGTVDDDRVLVLEVRRGASPPYGIQLGPDAHVQYYVRRGASTFPATPQEVREATLANGRESAPR